MGLPNLLSHFNQLSGRKVPKLLESYGTGVEILVFPTPTGYMLWSMSGKNRWLIVDEPIEFEK